MNFEQLKQQWLAEEACAHIHGWDFSHLDGRWDDNSNLPWDYREVLDRFRRPDSRILDLDTGGGEFLLSLHHPCELTAATEFFPPNAALCEKVLLPLGIDFRTADAKGTLPFPDAAFDLILDRHGDVCVPELWRLLKPGGVFVTEQVGEQNDRELVELLLPGLPLPYPGWDLSHVSADFTRHGFRILEAQEAFDPIRFYDVGALVWFARIIEWEFPGFSVEACFDRLLEAQKKLEREGALECRAHRFLLAVQKPD